MAGVWALVGKTSFIEREMRQNVSSDSSLRVHGRQEEEGTSGV